MSLVRDIPMTVNALEDTIFVTCSALMTSAASTSAVGLLSNLTTAGAVVDGGSGTTAFGRVVDRLRQPLGAGYMVAVAQAWLHSTRGSTEADRKLVIGCRLQHGDSSGGGDMADYSTGSVQSNRTYFSTARTTDMLQWDASESTGEVYAASAASFFDLHGVKRYVRVAVPIQKNRVTTESSGDEQSRLGAAITFLAGDRLPPNVDTTGPYSQSTSTV